MLVENRTGHRLYCTLITNGRKLYVFELKFVGPLKNAVYIASKFRFFNEFYVHFLQFNFTIQYLNFTLILLCPSPLFLRVSLGLYDYRGFY